MIRKEFIKLLDRYLAGNASEKEKELLTKIYQELEDRNIVDNEQLADIDLLETEVLNKLKRSLKEPEGFSVKQDGHILNPFRKKAWPLIAASFLIAFVITCSYWLYQRNPDDLITEVAKRDPQNFITCVNQTKSDKKIILSDGSYIILGQGGKIGYSRTFSTSKREIYLIGSGFFQVTKDHTKPFLVYTERLVTKVLGTSFLVNNAHNDTSATVTVKTGKVSVFKKSNFVTQNEAPDLNDGVIITPNQLVALDKQQQLIKKITKNPDILQKNKANYFDFDATSAALVFKKLEQAYGIKIIYDSEKLRTCSVTAHMGNETFDKKLMLICSAIDAHYEASNGDIIITSNGCN
ncbi:FecR family protein [Mucilaginibacter lappiensis]|uniref:FecR family protein n=1 Tax=Mucilaginibacter lappiensis TaxID=354630 RepID=A0A841JTH5_9SPHI|nr:FecR family protein [Mucilaginibacter lappiensis]MBB6131131.1 hypothetical protein [Mucilaginibacter lappiensis]